MENQNHRMSEYFKNEYNQAKESRIRNFEYINENSVYTVMSANDVNDFLKLFPDWKLQGGVTSVVKNDVASDSEVNYVRITTSITVEFYQALTKL